MKVFISIELADGETLNHAVRSILGTASATEGLVVAEISEATEGRKAEAAPATKRKTKTTKAEMPKAEEAPTEAPADTPADTPAEVVTKNQVASAARKKMNAGKREETEELIRARSNGDGRLSSVPAEEYAALLAEIEAL